jgi:enoyl-[acyl-carrier protein] reductase I
MTLKKWALILGGSKGLGLATAKKLSEQGYSLVVIHRDRKTDMPAIEKIFESIRTPTSELHAFNSDIINPDKRRELIKEIQSILGAEEHIHVFVHSIAKGNLKPMLHSTGNILEHQDFVLTLNAMALSLYDWVQAIIKAGINDKDMRVISFTSEGNSKAIPGYAAVSAAKVTLEAITRNMALELAPLGIKANCIQAGVTETESFALIPNSQQIKEHAHKRNPYNRLTTPEDVANVVYLLSRDEARWITGSILKVDGGESLR